LRYLRKSNDQLAPIICHVLFLTRISFEVYCLEVLEMRELGSDIVEVRDGIIVYLEEMKYEEDVFISL